jgi:C1A family cysteine protease
MTHHLRGWKKDVRDERDALRGKVVVKLPSMVDLSAFLPSVRDQGNIGSCTGFGIGGNLTGCAKQQNAGVDWFSPTWIYNGARLIEGTLPYDEGAYPRDCLEFLRSNGCLLELFRAYSDTLDTTDPTKWLCAKNARDWPIVSYARLVDGVDGIKGALAAGHLVSIGSPWFGSWNDTDPNGILPDDYGVVAGGHEFLCYGYDDSLGILFCQNSWGTSWGKAGRFAIRYSAIDAFKANDGYDAHIVFVNWTPVVDDDPVIPVRQNLKWALIAIGIVAVVILAMTIFKC